MTETVKQVDGPAEARFRALARQRVEAAKRVDDALAVLVDAARSYLAVGAEMQGAGAAVGMQSHVLDPGRTLEAAIDGALPLTGSHHYGPGPQAHHIRAEDSDRAFFAGWLTDGEGA